MLNRERNSICMYFYMAANILRPKHRIIIVLIFPSIFMSLMIAMRNHAATRHKIRNQISVLGKD